MLKKLLKVGIIDSIPSIMPIIIWTILSVLYYNESIAEGFALTYPYQFIFMLVFAMFVRGQVKNELKNESVGDKSYSGLLLSLIFIIILIILSYILRKNILSWFRYDVSEYSSVFMYGLIMLCCDYVIYYLAQIKQYENKLRDSFIIDVSWNLSRLVNVIIVSLFVSNYNIGLYITCLVQVIILIIFLSLRVHLSKFRIDLLNGIKYSVSEIPVQLMMALIYAIGYRNVASMSVSYVAAHNLQSLCTDTQWDIGGSAIDTVVTYELCKGDNSKNKYVRNCIAYFIILFFSSAIMIWICSFIYKDVNIVMTVKAFLIECCTFPVYGFVYYMEAAVMINNPKPIIFVIQVIRYMLRLYVTSFINSPYAMSYGVFISCIFSLIEWSILYRKYVKSNSNYL